MLKIIRRVSDIRTGGDVERCHGIRHQTSYSVAKHTWGALALLYILFPEYYARLSPYLLFHDVAEAWVGDIPAPTKRFSSQVRDACETMERRVHELLEIPFDGDLAPEDQRVLKACDHLELYLWACEEQDAGNAHARCIADELTSYFRERPLAVPAQEIFEYIDQGGYHLMRHSTSGLIREINNG